ncbi:GGDEF domain-containing protein [Devosia rhodophyticola]|uniref:diguanylate cyclase n=1 Tax=Devosia rhodophyticola TaxID=3026423 RepID=A0ABY7YXQ0_9HYPH|nr:GGDEF domain-containing protein [Devosia rhodophyticola]WDR05679.1 GGDEF domain-containing protein [Devosia rhodophyticola]
MSEQEFKLALSYANAAMKLLKRCEIPAYPHFYELLYTYATGVNVPLNARMNELFRSGQPLTTDVVEALCVEFLKSYDVNERITNVSERMHARIESVNDAIDTAMLTAESYSGSLKVASGDLDRGVSADDLKSMTRQLLSETQHMQKTNSNLEDQLEASREDISALQRDLEEVRRESMIDSLTKIANRKSFDESIDNAVEDAVRTGEPLCLIIVDIDHFKTFNDTFGHQTGDQVLRLVATTLKANIKGRDLAARYGGEEFMTILPTTDIAGAVIVAENIRKAIHAKELLKRSTNEKLGRITASFGVAQFMPSDTSASLIERADRCLYAAKNSGRNRVVSEQELAKIIAA